MENKVISHIAKNKIIYSILIVMIAVGGIVTMDFSSNTNDNTLSGNVEDLVAEPVLEEVVQDKTVTVEEEVIPKEEVSSIDKEEGILSIIHPLEGAKVNEGEILKIEWKNTDSGTGLSYDVFLTNPKDTSVGQMTLAKGVTKTETDFKVPYDMVSEAESIKAYTVNVSVTGSKNSVTGPTISFAHMKDPTEVTSSEEMPKASVINPAAGEIQKVALGDEVTIDWQGVAATETKASVYLLHSSTNQSILLAEVKTGTSSVTTTVASTLATGDYKVILKTTEATIEGGVLRIYSKEEATQTPQTEGMETKETGTSEGVTSQPASSETVIIPTKTSTTENNSPKTTQSSDTKTSPEEDPFSNIPGAIKISD